MQNLNLLCYEIARASCAALIASLMAAGAAQATTLRVPTDVATIQGGIDLAANGDKVLVAPGTYFENIDFLGKAIQVISARGPALTVIDGQRLHSVVRFQTGETRESILDGFTLQHGEASRDLPNQGGGVMVFQASPIIRNNIVQANSACSGNGIATYAGSPLITNNRIIDNVDLECGGGAIGGGIYIGGISRAVVTHNEILRNHAGMEGGGIGMNAAGTPFIAGNLIQGNSTDNYGGGVGTLNDSQPVFVNNLVQGNTARIGGGIVLFGSTGGTFANNTIVDNVGRAQGTQLWTGGTTTSVTFVNNILAGKGAKAMVWCEEAFGTQYPMFTANDVWTLQGEPMGGLCAGQIDRHGNVSIDPLFVGGGSRTGAFQLQAGSPLIDAGIAAKVSGKTDLVGAPRLIDGDGDGTRAMDMGALEYQLH